MKTASSILLLVTITFAAEDPGRILRPTEGAAVTTPQVDIIATASDGQLELDGKPLSAAHPFPNVLHATVNLNSGVHTLALSWEGGKKEIHFFTGANPPAGFTPFHQHPPLADVPCTQCHEVNKRGRFRFKGGCFDCHRQEAFVKVHTHDPARLEQCGMCHNAHGSTVKAHLLYPRETACKICHN